MGYSQPDYIGTIVNLDREMTAIACWVSMGNQCLLWDGTVRARFWNPRGLKWLSQEMSFDSSRLIESHEWDKLDTLTGLFILAPSVQTAHLDLRNLSSVVWDGTAKTKSLCRAIIAETWATGTERPVLADLYCFMRHSSVAGVLFGPYELNSLWLWGLIINYGGAVVSLSPAVEM